MLRGPARWIRGKRTREFSGHYNRWRAKRIRAIRAHYGRHWWRGRSVLEVGCGHGDIGAAFAGLGAVVTCSDARQEHLDTARQRHGGSIEIVPADLDAGWPFTERYDLILHLGVLYHLADPVQGIRDALKGADDLVLETEVCDSDDPDLVVRIEEAGYDQAFNSLGGRPSGALVERLLTEAGRPFERVDDDRCNSGMHRYDWPVTNSGAVVFGARRMWFIGPPSR